jgi:nucleoside-diphosphate-sugar epimerase
MKLLVTGAAGFIGSTYVRIAGVEHEIVVLDKLTYAGRPENLPEGVRLIEGAIEDPKIVREAMDGVEAVVNFAAESHVDRSIDDQDAFARTHVIGTGTLLDAARELGVARYLQARSTPDRSPRPRRSIPPRPTRRPRPPATCSSPPTSTPTGPKPRSSVAPTTTGHASIRRS